MEMNIPAFNEKGELKIIPSATSAKEDFDFFIGKWKLKNRKLKTRLNNCIEWIEFEATQENYKALQGLANIDHFYSSFANKPFEGMTMRLFDPVTRLWSIYWADSNNGKLDTPVVGSFENKIGQFFAKDIFNGREILVVFRWDATDVNNPVWSQAFSTDSGKTWEWNWYMYMSKW